MALDEHGIAFLAAARKSGVSFQRSATLGRQAIVAPRRILRAAYASATGASREVVPRVTRGWLDSVLRNLGAEEVVSIDASSYEGASIEQDLNQELPDELADRFTAVIDAGTLEHIFNFPVAIRNCMRLVEPGGSLLLITPTNNEAGHGFYQFSPELFYRVLSPRYGFHVEEMLLLEMARWRPEWYEVRDPMEVGSRGQFQSKGSTLLFIRASRVGSVSKFDSRLQQSDYVAQWYGKGASPVDWRWRRVTRYLVARAPFLKAVYHSWFTGRRWLYRRPSYSQLPLHFMRVDGPGLSRIDHLPAVTARGNHAG